MNLLPSPAPNAKWSQNATTIAGSEGQGAANNQLCGPRGLYIDDELTAFIVDLENHRVVAWKTGATTGEVVAGGRGQGNRLDQLSRPTDIIVDKETFSLLILDAGNRRLVRWSRQAGTTSGEIIFDNIDGHRFMMDDQKNFYVSDSSKHDVRRYSMEDKNGIVVAGGNGKGSGLNQLNFPMYLFVDRDYSIYVSDSGNHRVMKWTKGAKEGTVVAGGQGEGRLVTELNQPRGLWVDGSNTVYVVDSLNHRVMRWCEKEDRGTVIVGGNGQGENANQITDPVGLFFDRHGNLYVVDLGKDRIQRFSIETN